jgi:hypothetical protein
MKIIDDQSIYSLNNNLQSKEEQYSVESFNQSINNNSRRNQNILE